MSLNRKAMVLAVGAALAPCAYAQVTSPAGTNWEFYGKFYPEMTHSHGEGATDPSQPVSDRSTLVTPKAGNAVIPRWEMQTSNTYIGFRGDKQIAPGSKAIWQLEQSVNIDEGTVTDNSSGVSPSFANRNSFVGLTKAEWGTVRLGNMDTPFKNYGNVVGFLGVNSGNFVTPSNVKDKAGFGTSSSSSFNLRRANAIDFASPTILGGLQSAAQYSIGNPSEDQITTSPKRFPRVASWAVKWEKGPLYLGLMQEAHFDLFGGSNQFKAPSVAIDPAATPTVKAVQGSALRNTEDPSVNSKDTANQVVVVYKIGVHSFEADVTTKKYSESNAPTGKFQEYKNTAYMLLMENRWTNAWRTAFSYVKAGAGTCSLGGGISCTTSGLEGSQISAGVAYYVDPSAYVFGLVAKLKNGSAATYSNLAAQKPNPGEDITQIAVGLAYTF